jgi:alpha-ketoglutarate-dependent taurine dioxygenase
MGLRMLGVPIDAHRLQLDTNGFVVIQGYHSDQLLAFAERLGRPSPDARNPSLVRDLFPRPRSESTTNTLSSRYGTGEFPFHTETAYWRSPARYLFLYCVEPGSGDRPTLLLDLAAMSVDDRAILARELWVVRYTRQPYLTTVLDQSAKGSLFRYDPACMRPVEERGQSPVILTRVLNEVRAVRIYWRHAMLLILDNHRLLHGRGAANVADPDRHLRRVLVKKEGAT